MTSSLSSVVSNLVRAQMGASVPRSVTDDDLDRHVAELILKDAKRKAEAYGKTGIRAYISSNIPDSNAPKTNKRFLSSIIKSTDEHNKVILKAQAQAAQEVKREREEQEKQVRRMRAAEATEAERMRRDGRDGSRRSRKRRRLDDEDSWDRWDGRHAAREREKVKRNWETWDGNDEVEDSKRSSRHRRERSYSRSRSSSPTRHHKGQLSSKREDARTPTSRRHSPSSRGKRRDDTHHSSRRRPRSSSRTPSDQGDRSAKRRRRSRSPSKRYALDDLHDEKASPRSRSPTTVERQPDVEDRELALKKRLQESRKADSTQSKPVKAHAHGQSTLEQRRASRSPSPTRSLLRQSISRSSTPGPEPAPNLPSKMDRYLESYDPRLDVAPLSVPEVPANGLISDAEFEGWDAMLELIRIRREDKAEKKRMERLGLLPPKDKSGSSKKVAGSSTGMGDRWGGESVSVMDIEYKKKGSVREWDMGKEGF